MIYNIESIVERIMSLLGEPPASQTPPVAGEWEGLTLRNAVRDKIAPEAYLVIEKSDLYRIVTPDDIRPIPSKVYWGREGCGWVVLPEDFGWLVSFRMSDWRYAVTETSPQSIVHRQHGRWRGLRGSFERPVCLIGLRSGARVMEFFSCTGEDAVVDEGWYVPQPDMAPEGMINIPGRLLEEVIENISNQLKE